VKKYILLFLLLFVHKAHAQIVPGEACKTGACYGFGAPSGPAPNGYFFKTYRRLRMLCIAPRTVRGLLVVGHIG
jgi:hypothetical protein